MSFVIYRHRKPSNLLTGHGEAILNRAERHYLGMQGINLTPISSRV